MTGYRVRVALLALGTVLGFGSGFRELRHHACGMHDRREAFEHHVARVCVDAARDEREARGRRDGFDGRDADGPHGDRGHAGDRGERAADRPDDF